MLVTLVVFVGILDEGVFIILPMNSAVAVGSIVRKGRPDAK